MQVFSSCLCSYSTVIRPHSFPTSFRPGAWVCGRGSDCPNLSRSKEPGCLNSPLSSPGSLLGLLTSILFPPSIVLEVTSPRSLLVLPTPLLAAICQLLNLAADLFPQLIGCNYFVLVCKKTVALLSNLSALGAQTPRPTSSVGSRQRAGSPPHITDKA